MSHFLFESVIFVKLITLGFAYSTDCPDLIQFAFELGMKLVHPLIWTSLHGDCCNVTGIVCSNSRVIAINWNNYNLNGTINGTALSTIVKTVGLDGNSLTGSFPSILPSGLEQIYLSNSRLTGNLPPLPAVLQGLDCDGNKLGGDLPDFPNTLVYLGLGYQYSTGNHFSGTLKLNAPSHLRAYDNWITDILIQDTSQLTTSVCDISYNPLLGNPNIPSPTICVQYGLFNPNTTTSILSSSSIITKTPTNHFSSLYTYVSSSVAPSSSVHLIPNILSTSYSLSAPSRIHLISSLITSYSVLTTTPNISSITLAYSFNPLSNSTPLLHIVQISIKLILQILVLSLVLYTTPWKRAWKNKNKKTNTNALL